MKYLFLSIIVGMLFFFTGCKKDEDPVSAIPNSIEARINAARPYTLINVVRGSTFVYEKGGTSNSQFTDAYAIDGYFVFETSTGTQYCSLSQAKTIDIGQNAPRGGSLIALRYD